MMVALALPVFIVKARPLLPRRSWQQLLPRGWQRLTRGWRRRVRSWPPEVVAMLAILVCVVTLRAVGPNIIPSWAKTDKSGAAMWEEIQTEWPLLTTADTLLAIESMLKTLMVFSALWRAGTVRGAHSKEVCLASEPSWFLGLSVAARFVAFPIYDEAYQVMGPLGGLLPVACDVCTLTLLFCLCLGQKRACRRELVATGAVVAYGLAATRNMKMALKGNEFADVAFAASGALEVGASLAHLLHALLSPISDGCLCVTALLASAQFLHTYFFVSVFPLSSSNPDEIRAGIELVTGGAVLQFGLTLLALTAHVVRAGLAAEVRRVPGRGRRARALAEKPVERCAAVASPSSPPDGASDGSLSGDEPQTGNALPLPPSKESEPPKLLAGVPDSACCAPSCLANDAGLLYAGEQVLEVFCSEGCVFHAHERCFRACSRVVRQRCTRLDCPGKVQRFRLLSPCGE